MVQLQENSTTSLGVSYTVYHLELLTSIDDVQSCRNVYKVQQQFLSSQFFLSAFLVPQFVVILAGFLHNCMLYMAMCVGVSASDMEIATKIHYVDSMNHSTTHTQFLPKLT